MCVDNDGWVLEGHEGKRVVAINRHFVARRGCLDQIEQKQRDVFFSGKDTQFKITIQACLRMGLHILTDFFC